mgnify:CR=1 FL=1
MGRSAHTREERRGGRQPSSHIGGRRDYRPAKAPRGWRGGAPSRWVECRGGLMPSSQMGHAGPSPCNQIFSNSLRIDCIFCGEM